MQLPNDPVMLMSVINLKLRDFYSNLDALCEDMDIDKEELCEKLLSGEIPEETILVNPRHYCEHKSAGMTFKLTD